MATRDQEPLESRPRTTQDHHHAMSPLRFPFFMPVKPGQQWRIAAALLATLLFAGCAQLPKNVERPVSTAIANPADTELGRLVAARKQAAAARNNSGFLLLSGPQDAYSSRLALVDAAQKTLDLQYYAIHADASTERLLRGVVAAAQRGVRVRVLLDDFHSTGRDAQVMRLAFVPNVEMRMFNPVAGARGSAIGRMWSALGDFSRAQQRMHNKLFIADNAMGVTGGRNLGDAYFGNSEAGNFVDLDVLAAGPIVQDLSRSFDSYWNNERAYPVQSLITKDELDELRARIRAQDAAKQEPTASQDGSSTDTADAPSVQPANDGAVSTPTQRARIWNYDPMDLKQAGFVWAPAAVLVDKPAKIPADDTSTATLPDRPPARATPLTITSQGQPAAALKANTVPLQTAAEAKQESKTGLAAAVPGVTAATTSTAAPGTLSTTPAVPFGDEATTAALTEAQTDTVVDGLLQLMGQAQRDLLIISPYFVPGPDMLKAFAGARARGVRIRVLTNSLASNDAPIAHAGYARHRPALLAMGVELYEMRGELTSVLRGALGSTGSTGAGTDSGPGGSTGSSRAMLHSKVLIMDGRLLAIGSMNLDMRSQRQNTEVALLIRSTALSRQASTPIEAALRSSAWHVEQTDNGLLWRAPEGSGLADATTEPDASAPLRLMLKILGPLAPDHLL